MKLCCFEISAGLLVPAVIILLLGVVETYAAPDELFRQANEAYSRAEYTAAVDLYKQCLAEAQSGALHYNMGNAYFQTGEIGLSVLHYEKALALRPNNPEARVNLQFVRESAQLPEPQISIAYRWARTLPLDLWSWMTAIGLWGSVALLMIPRMFGGANALTRFFLFAGLLLLMSSAVALYGYKDKSRETVVLRGDTPLRVAPAGESPPADYMHAGELAVIARERQDFYFINSQNGKSGWVRSDEIGKIWD